ncbi:hypothetical protein [Novilysobacter selenitireducens]|uniref:RiboL-PSP-HEPN domain-containing protein n=1 Tax=Novilysobacter selenitireducens TaxID=2872639 RepID=A0ABS7T5G8_9GAMM|nr:hypothetical protein [Lysobacter selenitireducens]MBZ4039098.1 hypothetical protein [Lysobacter selenitireducens]
MKQQISDRFDRNISRVRNLVSIYRTQLSGAGRGRRGHEKTDVLRAAVVLLHASMEDVLRSLAYWKLPAAAPEVLAEIPLKGSAAIKFTLGSLSAFRGSTVEDVIKASIDSSLERSNYNNTTEVISLLQSLSVDTAPLAGHMAELEKTMKRRHKIVHRADENENPGRGRFQVEPISPATVDAWASNTETFVQAVLVQV